MSSYEVFGHFTPLAMFAWAIAASGFLIERARTGTWSSRSTRFFAALMFFSIPATALFRVLSRPLSEHSAQFLWLHVGGILLWLAAGAANTFRAMRPEAKRFERPIT